MMCYRDMSFCKLSHSVLNTQPIRCDNQDCDRHCCHIPNNLPEWELICYAEFINCKYYQRLIKNAKSS